MSYARENATRTREIIAKLMVLRKRETLGRKDGGKERGRRRKTKRKREAESEKERQRKREDFLMSLKGA